MIWIILILFVVSLLAIKVEKCPREMLHYNCRGKGCDHSPEAIQQAQNTLDRNKL